jgi:type I restriction enzyme M protein
MNTKEVLDKIFKDPKTKYELAEFETLGKPIHEIIEIYPKIIDTGQEAGKTKYFTKSFAPFSSRREEVQVFVEDGKSTQKYFKVCVRMSIVQDLKVNHFHISY